MRHVALVVLLAGALSAAGQSSAAPRQANPPPATVSGTVRDTNGGGIPDATVVTRLGTVDVATVTTDARGHFMLPAIGPGAYEIAASLPNFKTSRRKVVLAAGAAL